MIHVEATEIITATRQKVFTYIDSVEKVARLEEEIEPVRIHHKEDGAVVAEVKMKFLLWYKEGQVKFTFQPPERVIFEILEGPFKGTIESFVIEQAPEGARATHIMDIDLGIPLVGRLIERAASGAVKAHAQREVLRLKRAVEQAT
ncbi:MAG: SRPBCC family protein [Dehalococcoidales bacterium]|nr:SRPBCC family protein [Dehalococcoidales bacterium]